MPAYRFFQKPQQAKGRCHGILSALLLLLWQLSDPVWATETEAEARKVYSGDSPAWLQLVGRLDVPGFKYKEGRRVHHRENCTATLIGRDGAQQADHVVTAWHCLEFYRDLSMTITFSLPHHSASATVREARKLVDGGGITADWAILRLTKPVPLLPSSALLVDAGEIDKSEPLVMAGYSGDSGLGQSGEALTYHENCRQVERLRQSTHTDCQAYKGASGGPVVRYSESGAFYLAGVISQGNGEGTSTYIPISRFRGMLNSYLY
ncbi:MAG: serine protease [Halieaceae bacterium]